MVLDLLALAILAAFVLAGALRGAVASATGVGVLVVGYAAALGAASLGGASLASALGLPALLGPAVAGSLAFAAVFVLGAGAGSLLRGWDRRRRGDDPRSAGDRLVGALFGAVRGGLVVVLLGVLALWLDAGRELTQGQRFAAAPRAEKSAVASASGRVAEEAVRAALGEGSGGRAAGRVVGRPAETLAAVQEIVRDPALQAVQRDRLFWTYVRHGSVQSALNRGSFWRVVRDDALRARLAEVGVLDEAAAGDPRLFREQAEQALAALGPHLPAIEELAADPEIRQLVESGDTLGLVAHPDVQQLVARVSAAR